MMHGTINIKYKNIYSSLFMKMGRATATSKHRKLLMVFLHYCVVNKYVDTRLHSNS